MKAALGMFLIALLALLTSQIFGRSLRIRFFSPPEEIITLVFTWFVFLGSAVLFREKQHLTVDLVPNIARRKPRTRRMYDIAVSLVQMVFLAVFLWSAYNLFLRSGTRHSPMLKLPQRIWTAPILVSAILMVIFDLGHFVAAIMGIDSRSDKDDPTSETKSIERGKE